MDEALENIKEAIAGCLESLAEERTMQLEDAQLFHDYE